MSKLLVKIWDCGSGCELAIDSEGNISVINSGGNDVHSALGGSVRYCDEGEEQELAEEVLADWCKDYEGDAAVNRLTVRVLRDGVEKALVSAQQLGWFDQDDEDQEHEEEKADANKWQVWTKVDGVYHSSHASYRDAVDQADMIHGWVTSATGISDKRAWTFAVANQGCELTWDQWQSQDDDEREQWELGAQGIGTV